jgi:peptidoglycan/LPS O-acetylase OafA/YrhL
MDQTTIDGKPTGLRHIGYLDGWRGLAIGMVLIAHFCPIPGVELGRFGVDLFFALSGLLMAGILFERRTPIAEFYRRRVARIFPAFLVFLVLVLTISALLGNPTSWRHTLGLLTFTRAYMTPDIWQTHGVPVGHMWSLAVEEHSYVLLSIAASIAALRSGRTLIALGLSTFLAVIIYRHFDHSVDAHFLLRTECAAGGLLLSAGYRLLKPRSVPSWAPVIALLLTPLCYLDGTHWLLRVVVPPFLLAFAVNHLDAAASWVTRMLETTWLRWLGIVSYSVYLWQQPFYMYQQYMPFHAAALLAVGAGAASFYWLEQPVRVWLNTHWGQTRAPAKQYPEPLPQEDPRFQDRVRVAREPERDLPAV